MRRSSIVTSALCALALGAGFVFAAGGRRDEGGESPAALLGYEFRETKDELKLKYDVKLQDNGGGRMSVVLTLEDEGRLKPMSGVSVAVPSKDGSGYFDVVISVAPYEKDGKKIYTLHLTRELAERAQFDLKTNWLDGKRLMEWGYHAVRLEKMAKAVPEVKAKE